MRHHSPFRGEGRQQQRQPVGVQRIDALLDDLLAQFSARFPQFKFVIVNRTENFRSGGNDDEIAPLSHPA
jgi:hypothetical protein